MVETVPVFPDLHDAVAVFAEVTLRQLCELYRRGQLPTTYAYVPRLDERGNPKHLAVGLPVASTVLDDGRRNWSTHSLFPAIQAAMASRSAQLEAWQQSKEELGAFVAGSLFRILNDYWGTTVSSSETPGGWDVRRFETLYAGWEQSLRQPRPAMEAWIPLYGIALESVQSLPIDEFTLLFCPTDSDRLWLAYHYPADTMFTGSRAVPRDLASLVFAKRSYPTADLSTAFDIAAIDRILAAVRLVVGGSLRYREVCALAPPGHYCPPGYTGRMFAPPHPLDLGPGHTAINPWNHAEIAHYYRGLDRVQNDYPVAYRRYQATGERLISEDRVVDAVVGLESLLLPDGGQNELSYRMALRGAYVLGRSAAKREEYFQRFKTAYNLRSNIVHGSDRSRRSTISQMDDATELLRLVLRALIDRGADRQAWITFLQTNVFGEPG